MTHPDSIQPRLLKTTAVRLALRYALIYAMVLIVGIAAVWWMTGRHVNKDMRDRLEGEMARLLDIHDASGIQGLSAALDTPGGRLLSVLTTRKREKIAGNLVEWPEDGPKRDGRVRGQWLDDDALPESLHAEDDLFAAMIAVKLPDGSRLMLAEPVDGSDGLEETTELLAIVALALGFALVAGVLMSIVVSRQVLKRMYAVNETVDEIMAGDLSRRVPVSNRGDEFDSQAVRLNSMLDRIQQLIKGIREVTDNIAHDLRTPLTRMRNRFEVTLLEPRESDEYRDALEQGMQETEELIRTFNALLNIAQVEAGNHRGVWTTVRLDKLADDLVELYEPLAEDKNQSLVFNNGQVAEVHGSRDLLTSLLHNLLENAIKYTPEGGKISLTIRREAKSVLVVVEDTGPGIPAVDQERVLQRFVRLEDSRHTQGNGLGLSLVSAVARLHRAELLMTNTNPGLKITLRFPDKK